ncbi:MAG: hypothetical protein K2N58_11210, partial [Treponemataceae bacterium]|nr:hypothetical protein [Treponemataceae bacterium]
RTRKSSPPAPMILPFPGGKAGGRRAFFYLHLKKICPVIFVLIQLILLYRISAFVWEKII